MLLVTRMAAEFQGFARDLHDEAAGFLAFRCDFRQSGRGQCFPGRDWGWPGTE